MDELCIVGRNTYADYHRNKVAPVVDDVYM